MPKVQPPANIPQASGSSGASSPVKESNFVANYHYYKGNVLHSAAGNGWWVCTANHVSGNGHGLRPGESNDIWHWSVGPS